MKNEIKINAFCEEGNRSCTIEANADLFQREAKKSVPLRKTLAAALAMT